MEENIVQDQTNQPTEVQNQPPKPWLKIVLLGLVGLIVVGGLVFAGYKLGQREEQAKLPQPTPVSFLTPTSTPTPTPKTSPITVVATPSELTPTPDPTADWKTYTNTKYGYSIKYPSNWWIEREYALISDIPSEVYEGPISPVPLPYEIDINELKNPKRKEFKELIISNNMFPPEMKESFSFQEEKIGSYRVFRTSDVIPSYAGELHAYFEGNGGLRYIDIVLWPYNKDTTFLNQNRVVVIFDQILSTFRFLD